MKVTKRNGSQEDVKLEKIHSRILKNCYELDMNFVEPLNVAMKVISGLVDGITTKELDKLASEEAAALVGTHPDYSKLAARIAFTSLYKETNKNFSKTIETLYKNVDPETGESAPLVSDELYAVVKANKSVLNSAIIKDRDYLIDYFGFKTLERSYLLKSEGKIVETPQHMFMRVALGIHGENIDKAIESYNYTSEKWFTHATPTLFNSGTRRAQMSSCFLVANKEDAIGGLFETLGNVAKISKWAGGIGLHIHDVRAKGSYIKGTGGKSDGIVPMLKTYNEVARWINQGGKRKGSFAIYLEPWHSDIFEFLDLRKNHGKEEMRARDLFSALWTCDLFMERVENNAEWTLMCPSECPGLSDVYGEEFNKLYTKYESEGKGKKTIKAQDLWYKILESQMETGTPYMLYKDAANKKSNQQNLGTIKSSNLCTEIIEYSEPGETAVCNLASIALPMFVEVKDKRKKGASQEKEFNFKKLIEITTVATKNLNLIIDRNYYPIPETEISNSRHRPIGLGVQGLADVFQMMGIAFDSEEAKQLNKDIFETIYYAALKTSMELAKADGAYETFEGSPASKGILQFDMWDERGEPVKLSEKLAYDWVGLKEEIKENGLRNSLLVAPMPTASTSQILGNNECFEPYTSNIYSRRTLSGEFMVINKHLVKDLVELGIWSEEIKQQLIFHKGSVQNIQEIPDHIKAIYKTVWEISQKVLLDMSADRGAFICQSQSLNVFIDNPNFGKLTSMHFYGWKKGLKTGMYYLRTKAAMDAKQVTVSIQQEKKSEEDNAADMVCSIENPDDCDACGS